MLQKLLMLFTTEEKVLSMLESPIIHMIFMVLFSLFFVTVIIHLTLFFKIRSTRNHLKITKQMDIEPLRSMKEEFETRQLDKAFKTETFVQEKFSSWPLFGLPIISLLKIIQMTISIFILLGVLGTFIGLTISLGSIGAVEDELIENVANVLTGIDIAFFTSIVGMSFSLVMTVLIRLFNTEYLITDMMLLVESHLESHEQHGMHKMISVSEMIHTSLQSVVSAFDGFKDYTAGLQDSARDLAIFNDGLSKNLRSFEVLFQEMQSVTNSFGEGTSALNDNFNQLFTYFKNIDKKNERMITTFENIFDRITNVSSKQIESFLAFDDSVSELKTFTQSIVAEQNIISDNIANVFNGTKDLVVIMGEQKSELKNIFGDDLHVKLSGITTYLESLANNFTQFGQAITPLPSALEFIEQTQVTQNKLTEERLRELTSFNERFSNHLKNHTSESASFQNHLSEATTTFERIGQKNNQFLVEIDQVITHLANNSKGHNEQIHANIALVKDTFTNYAASLEATLSQKLDTLIRNIDSSIHLQQDEVKREFIEMRRIADEINNNNVRSQQQLLSDLTREIQGLTRQLSLVQQQSAPISEQAITKRIDLE